MSKLDLNRTESYFTNHVKNLLPKIVEKEDFFLCLLGFSETMKWLSRILSEADKKFALYDWRDKYYGYDCCSHNVQPYTTIISQQKPLIIICVEDIILIKESIKLLVYSDLKHIPVVLDYPKDYSPIEQEKPYIDIAKKAKKKAPFSMSTNERLYNLMQLIIETKNVPGDIVEFGTYVGGTAAIIIETLNYFNINKKVFLFDTFGGIPKANLGIDSRWSGMFSNVSLAEVKDKFSEFKNVRIFPGDVFKTIENVNFPISFAHVDVDTYEAANIVTSKVWPYLNNNGIILFDDYGFLKNCLPLTVFVDEFIEQHPDVFKFFLPSKGLFLIKNNL